MVWSSSRWSLYFKEELGLVVLLELRHLLDIIHRVLNLICELGLVISIIDLFWLELLVLEAAILHK